MELALDGYCAAVLDRRQQCEIFGKAEKHWRIFAPLSWPGLCLKGGHEEGIGRAASFFPLTVSGPF
jgi:hypothetical protein